MPKAPEPSSTCQKTTKSLPRISPKSYCYNAVPNRFLAHFSTSRTNGPRSLSRVKAGTHSPFGERSHTAAHTAKQGRFGWGWYHYPRYELHVHEYPRAGCQNGKLCRFWVLVGGAPKERREPSGQRCAYARRCPEASWPRWAARSFPFLSKLRLVCPALRAFPCVRGAGWYHYPQRALCAVEMPDGRLLKRLTCRFLRSGGRSSPHDSYFLANTQNFLLAVPVANAFALWYDKFDKLELSN